jgi:SH3-like domain-containing protein
MAVAEPIFGVGVAVLGAMLITMTPAWAQGTGATPVVQPRGPTHAVRPAPASDALPLPPPPAPGAPPLATTSPATQATPPPPAQDPAKGSNSHLPIPRFVSLHASQVNLRAGPGERYPIEWVYQRRDLPVEVEREFDIWRLIRDVDGVRGWVQEVMLMERRSFVVTGSDRTLRHDPDDKSSAVAILKPGVIGRIRSCAAQATWCQVQADDFRGWLPRDAFWGTLPGEPVGN